MNMLLKLVYMRLEIYKRTRIKRFDSINATNKEKNIIFTTYPVASIIESTHFWAIYDCFFDNSFQANWF